METINTALIGKYIKSLRLSNKMSQDQLAKITGLSASGISNIELGNKGVSYNISLPTLVKIAHALNTNTIDLLSNSGYLCAVADEKYETNRTQVYIHNQELINLYNRLSPTQQRELVEELKAKVTEKEQANQQNLFKKKP